MLKKSDIADLFKNYDIELFGIMPYGGISSLFDCRAKARLPLNAQSVIVCLFPYALLETPHHNVCRYAFFKDYHTVIGDVLKEISNELEKNTGCCFEPFTDNSPIPEVECAIKAGLGFMGKNGLLINEKYGSYVLIGEIVTDAVFEYDEPNTGTCLNCGACETHCPSGAIGGVEMSCELCLSHITQRKGELFEHEIKAIKKGGLVWGCDICQEYCPHNIVAVKSPYSPFLESIEPILTNENIDDLIKDRPYGYKGKKLLQRNLDIISDDL